MIEVFDQKDFFEAFNVTKTKHSIVFTGSLIRMTTVTEMAIVIAVLHYHH